MLPFYRWGNQSSKGFDGFLRVVHVASVRLVTETTALFALCQSRCGGWSSLLTWLDLDSPRKHTSRCLWACLQKCLPSRKDNSKWAAPSTWWIGVPGWIQSSSRLSTSVCLSVSWLDALHVCSYQHGFLLRWTYPRTLRPNKPFLPGAASGRCVTTATREGPHGTSRGRSVATFHDRTCIFTLWSQLRYLYSNYWLFQAY